MKYHLCKNILQLFFRKKDVIDLGQDYNQYFLNATYREIIATIFPTFFTMLWLFIFNLILNERIVGGICIEKQITIFIYHGCDDSPHYTQGLFLFWAQVTFTEYKIWPTSCFMTRVRVKCTWIQYDNTCKHQNYLYYDLSVKTL